MTEASNRKGIAKNNDKFHFYTIARAMQGIPELVHRHAYIQPHGDWLVPFIKETALKRQGPRQKRCCQYLSCQPPTIANPIFPPLPY